MNALGTQGAILVVGAYMTDAPNCIDATVQELARSRDWTVDQHWIALGRGPVPRSVADVTTRRCPERQPKFRLMNEALAQTTLGNYAFVFVCDDDIHLPENFIDKYLALVTRHELALAQPARTHDSYTDHVFVEQLDGIDARSTMFVEIGPCFSMRRDVVPLLVPFDEASPMGWGYDFVWPHVLSQRHLRLGIVDATPVTHRLRRPVSQYNHGHTERVMMEYLRARDHLATAEAFVILESYA